MITADTSVWINFAKGYPHPVVKKFERALSDGVVVMSPVVLFEVLSGLGVTPKIERLLSALPRLNLHAGYWERAAKMRQSLLKKGFKSRTADTLIAQNCIDEETPLLVSDSDFRHYQRFGLLLLK